MATCCFVSWASETAMLLETVDLPMPPLTPKTVTMVPSRVIPSPLVRAVRRAVSTSWTLTIARRISSAGAEAGR